MGDLYNNTSFLLQSFLQFSHKQFQVDTCDKLENYTVSLTTSYVFDSPLKILVFSGADMVNYLMVINDYLLKPVDISNVISVGKGALLDL